MCGVGAVSLFKPLGEWGCGRAELKSETVAREARNLWKMHSVSKLALVLINIVEKVILMLMCVLDDLDVV